MRAVLRRGAKQSPVSAGPARPLDDAGPPAPSAATRATATPPAPPAPVVERHRAAAAERRNLRRDAEEVLEVGDVHLDVSRHECIVRGLEVKLPLKEFELLEILLANAGRVVTRDTLIDRVWGLDYVGDTKTLDVHIKRLRSRIEADSTHPVLITTIRGVGYRFEAPRR